jgi:hypothetical protein
MLHKIERAACVTIVVKFVREVVKERWALRNARQGASKCFASFPVIVYCLADSRRER